MSWMISITLAFAQFSVPDKIVEVENSKSSSKCSFDPSSDFIFSKTTKNQLLVFTSFSVPLATWKETSYHLERLKGAFVLRGLPHHSFEELQKKILEFRKEGIRAEILLDPEAFEKYEITSTPATVLIQDKNHDRVLGNLQIPYVLTLFSESGDTKEEAAHLLQTLEAY